MGSSTIVQLPRITPQFLRAVKLGQVPGYQIGEKFGYNPDAGATPEAIWASGGPYTGFIDAATTVEVLSDSADDTAAGIGARTVRIFGLGASGLPQDEVLTMDGTTPVVSSNVYLRVTRIQVQTVGTSAANVGVIDVRSTGAGSPIMASILIGANQSTLGALTVVANHDLYILNSEVGISRLNGSDGSAVYSLRVRDTASDANAAFQSKRYQSITTAQADNFTSAAGVGPFPPLADIVFQTETRSDASTSSFVYMEYLLVQRP